MNKKELAEEVAAATELTKAQGEAVVEAVIDAIGGALAKGDSVAVAGFGTFEVRHRAARKGRNPQTGAEIKIPAGKRVKLTAGSKLKAAVK